jgi:hypothetical protein
VRWEKGRNIKQDTFPHRQSGLARASDGRDAADVAANQHDPIRGCGVGNAARQGALRADVVRIPRVHPNRRCGSAGLAGHWPPAWVARLTGDLKAAGHTDVNVAGAMTHHLSEEQARERIETQRPAVGGCTAITLAITPAITLAIHRAERLPQTAEEVNPASVRLLGGIHRTFMHPRVLKDAHRSRPSAARGSSPSERS